MDLTKTHPHRPSVALTTLGCKLNQAETDDMARRFVDAGFEVVDFDSCADAYVVNTCTVTHVADRKSRQMIRQARQRNLDAVVAATGCYVNVAAAEVARIAGVDLLVPNADKYRLPSLVRTALGHVPDAAFGHVEHMPRSDRRTRAFVRIQDGCNQFCTYCIVPVARGRERSVAPEVVLSEVRQSIATGHKEVVLTGVHIGTYGRDLKSGPGETLSTLVATILRETDVPRLRLSSIEPQDFDVRLLTLLQDSRLCRHLHLPLQSGSDSVLRRMHRHYAAARFREIARLIAETCPDAAITTDVIVGFPGETEDEFTATCELIAEIGFAGVHIFKYSQRDGTPAAEMQGQVPYQTKRARSEALAKLAQESASRFRRRFIDRPLWVLFESVVPDSANGALADRVPAWEGLSDNYLRVFVDAEDDLTNHLRRVLVVDERDGRLIGRLHLTC